MKKKVIYNVDVSVDDHGVLLECQCDCGAGMGPEAHCKHVCLVIYALVKFTQSKHITVRKTCTEMLQTFHKAKKYKGRPLEAKELNLRTGGKKRSTLKDLASYDPRPARFIKEDHYQTRFFNLCLNYSVNSMPITQLVKPANLYAVAHDHDYLQFSPEEMFLREMNISYITNYNIQNTEIQTRGQHKNSSWYKERSIRITSSNFGRICNATSRTDFNNLSKTLLKNKTPFMKASLGLLFWTSTFIGNIV